MEHVECYGSQWKNKKVLVFIFAVLFSFRGKVENLIKKAVNNSKLSNVF